MVPRRILDRNDPNEEPKVTFARTITSPPGEVASTQDAPGLAARIVGNAELTPAEQKVVAADPCTPLELATCRRAVEARSSRRSEVDGSDAGAEAALARGGSLRLVVLPSPAPA